jgi:hypothetical protein
LIEFTSERRNRGIVGHVDWDYDVPVRTGQVGRKGFQSVSITCREDKIVAGCCQATAQGYADAAGRARDKDCLRHLGS